MHFIFYSRRVLIKWHYAWIFSSCSVSVSLSIFTSVECGLVTVLCMQCLTLLAQETYSTSHAINSKMFSRLYYNLSKCFMFVNTVLIRIYITLGTIVKRYKDQLHDTMNQLHENISTRQLVLICRAYTMLTWQFTWILLFFGKCHVTWTTCTGNDTLESLKGKTWPPV